MRKANRNFVVAVPMLCFITPSLYTAVLKMINHAQLLSPTLQ
jgi:hypothetical protein